MNGTSETNNLGEKRQKLSVQVPRALRMAVLRYFTDRAWQKKRAGEAVAEGALKGYSYGMPEAICWLMSLKDTDLEAIIKEGTGLLGSLEELGPGYSGPLPWGQRSGSVFCGESGPVGERGGKAMPTAVVRDAHPTEAKPRGRGKGKDQPAGKRGHAPVQKA